MRMEWRRWRWHPSLFWRVLVVNAAVLVAAAGVLSLTPAKVPAPLGLREVSVLVAGLGVMVIANGVLLQVSFGPLKRLVRLMGTIDLRQPQRLPATGGVEVRTLIAATVSEPATRCVVVGSRSPRPARRCSTP